MEIRKKSAYVGGDIPGDRLIHDVLKNADNITHESNCNFDDEMRKMNKHKKAVSLPRCSCLS